MSTAWRINWKSNRKWPECTNLCSTRCIRLVLVYIDSVCTLVFQRFRIRLFKSLHGFNDFQSKFWKSESHMFFLLRGCQSASLWCLSSQPRLRCRTQSAPSQWEACGADSWDGTAWHIHYCCHQQQETSHKWSGLWVSEDVYLVKQQYLGLPMLKTTYTYLPSPSVSTLSALLLIATVWHWRTVIATEDTVWGFTNYASVKVNLLNP